MLSRHCLCAVLLGLMAGGFAIAAESPRKAPTTKPAQKQVSRTLKGDLIAVDIEKRTLTIKTTGKQDTKEVVVETDASTEFSLDGDAADLVDLRVGMRVSVLPETGVATRVSARAGMNDRK